MRFVGWASIAVIVAVAGGSLWFSDYGIQLSRQFRALKV